MTDEEKPTLQQCTRRGCKGSLSAIYRVREVIAYKCDRCGHRIAVPKPTIGMESKR